MAKLTTKQTVEAYQLIEKHVKKIEGGLIEYHDGFNDKRIAAMVGQDVPESSISRIRSENFGKLATRPGGVDPRVSMLDGRLSDMTDRFNKLVETLSVNRITDVRHLRIKPQDQTGEQK